MAATTEQCPWCGSTISHDQFVRIQREIRDEEKRKFAATEKELRLTLQKEFDTKRAAEVRQLASDRRAITAERAKLAEERRAIAEQSKRQVELAKQAAEKQRQKELNTQREILTKDKDDALLRKDAAFARERENLQKKVAELSRRVEQKTAGEAGDGAEIDLFEELRAEFPGDNITRIQKGKPGGDILHAVRYKGEECGSILIDSKNRQAWNSQFVKKLRQDQTDAGADYAILSTTVFPAGKKELCIESGVILVSPSRATVLVDLLRKSLVGMHVAKLGRAERATKQSRLFDFIASPEFKQKLSEAEALAADALQIDVDEKRAHDNMWKKRGTVLTRIKNVLREIDTDVAAIVEAREPTPIAAMTLVAQEH